MSDHLASWLVTYLVHSTLLLGLAWVATRTMPRRWRLQDHLWKAALVGGLVTASVQVVGGIQPPWGALVIGEAPVLGAAVPMAELPPTAAEPSLAFDWTVALLALWALGAAFGLGRLASAWLGLRRRLASRRLYPGTLVHELTELAGAGHGIRLSLSDEQAVPIAWGVWRPEICLPSRIDELDRVQQRALLAHELAHLERADPAWRIITQLISAVFFLQPLNLLAKRRLEPLAELLCDDWAARKTREGVALAKCLTEVATWVVAREDDVVPAMAAHRSDLGYRVATLIEEATPRRARAVPFGAAMAVVLLLGGLAWAGPGAKAAKPPESVAEEGELVDARQARGPDALTEQLDEAIASLLSLRRALTEVEAGAAETPVVEERGTVPIVDERAQMQERIAREVARYEAQAQQRTEEAQRIKREAEAATQQIEERVREAVRAANQAKRTAREARREARRALKRYDRSRRGHRASRSSDRSSTEPRPFREKRQPRKRRERRSPGIRGLFR